MKKNVKTFIKELIPYILTGALGSSVAFNVKLIKENNIKDITSMPYSQDVEGSEDGIIRDAHPKLEPPIIIDKNNISDYYNEF
jgi:hypothetical protein